MTSLTPQPASVIIPILEEKLSAYGLTRYSEHIPALSAFLAAFTSYNADHNLTGETDLARLIERHVIESLFIHSLLPAGTASLCDIGTGGGFPGAIIACISPKETEILLVESVQKKAAFLSKALKAYPNVTVLAERAEDTAKQKPYLRHFDAVTMRAVTDLETSVQFALPFMKPAGRIILCKPKVDFDMAEGFLRGHDIALETYSEFTIEGRQRGIGMLQHIA